MTVLWVFWMFYMLKKIVFTFSVVALNSSFAAHVVNLYQAPLSSLAQYTFEKKPQSGARLMAASAQESNSLQQVNQTQQDSKTVTRYQQLYKGIPIIGSQITITTALKQGINASETGEVNGHLLDEIQINIKPTLSEQQAIVLAKKAYFSTNPQSPIQENVAELQIRPGQDGALKLVYLVSFKCAQMGNKPAWPFFIFDAQTGEIIKQWDNIKNFLDSGPGGNEKVHEYWYGKDGLPALDVTQKGSQCVMETPSVKLINLKSVWDWDDRVVTPFQYPCNSNREENINGAFSPSNDAYYFGHTIVSMYKDWYGLNALQHTNGQPMKLIMRVHFGRHFDNAFWDGQVMSFGDGQDFYPLVSLDVAGHEVTHGFTQQHSGLEYHDQSGALNESLSDMAGQASRAYLLEKTPQLYGKAYLQPNEVTWGIGETIIREAFGKALRFMDFPSSDGRSADCFDKHLATSNGSICAISYDELVAEAESKIADPNQRQSFIVHTASGVFNKAFYLLSKNMGIKKAYHLMIIANTKYWTPTTEFNDGACGVLHAANDLNEDINMVQSVFGQVGVNTKECVV